VAEYDHIGITMVQFGFIRSLSLFIIQYTAFTTKNYLPHYLSNGYLCPVRFYRVNLTRWGYCEILLYFGIDFSPLPLYHLDYLSGEQWSTIQEGYPLWGADARFRLRDAAHIISK
jgi:hypothetical protein